MTSIRVLSIIAGIFGIMTVISGSAVLFPNDFIQKSAGNYVDFVVWFNMLSGFAYIAAAVGLWNSQKWSVTISIVLTSSIAVVLLIFGIHVWQGGLYEMRTLYALILRMLLWFILSIVSYRRINNLAF